MVAKGYKQTEVGVIPEDWTVLSFPDITDNLPDSIKIGPFGSALKKELLVKSGYKVYGQENVYSNDMLLGDRYLNKDHFNKLKSCEVKPKDFLISMMGTVGKCAIIPSNIQKGIIDSHLIRIRVNDSKFNQKLLLQLFRTKLILNQIKQLSVGGIMEGLSSKIIKKLYIPIPPKAEQKAIATALSDVDELIASLERLIAKKEDIKTATMQQLLTGKKRLDGFSGEWVERTIEEIAVNLDNLRVPLNENQRNKMKGDIPYCGANGIVGSVNDYVIDDDIILMAEDGGYFDEYTTRPIAYRMIGKVWVNNHAHILKAKDWFSQDFLFYSLVHKDITKFLAGGTRAKLNKSEMYKITIACPEEKDEQVVIATILLDMDKELEALKTRLEKTKAIKVGMMQELLTGKTRLLHQGGEKNA